VVASSASITATTEKAPIGRIFAAARIRYLGGGSGNGFYAAGRRTI
jgi:hypothetical protein